MLFSQVDKVAFDSLFFLYISSPVFKITFIERENFTVPDQAILSDSDFLKSMSY